MSAPKLQPDEIQWIGEHLESTWAGCTPIFVKDQNRPITEFGRVDGTLTLVTKENRFFAVTAHHVIAKNTDKQVYSPIRPGWHMKSLRDYDWRILSIVDELWMPDIDVDLAIAELSAKELSEIDPSRFCTLYPCVSLIHPFRAVARGYLKKKHRRRDVEKNGVAISTSFGLVSSCIKNDH